MLSQEQELILSEYSGLYDIVVPQDNLLRRINTLGPLLHANAGSHYHICRKHQKNPQTHMSRGRFLHKMNKQTRRDAFWRHPAI
jgi:hypothetical protein